MSEMTPEEKIEINKKFDELNMKMTRILGILENDTAIGEDGLVKKVRTIGAKLEELLVREQVYKAKATTWGIIGGAIGTVLFWFGKFIITKVLS